MVIGNTAATNAVSGSDNVIMGANAGANLTSGANNTALGYGADVGAALTNATAIGNGATVSASNTIQLGNNSVLMTNTAGQISVGGAGVNGNQGYFWGGGLAGLNYTGISCNAYPTAAATWSNTAAALYSATCQFVNDAFYIIQSTTAGATPLGGYTAFQIANYSSGNHIAMNNASPTTAAIIVGTTTSDGNGATLSATGNWTNTSDSTKKRDIQNISYGLSEVMKLRPVSYEWKGTDIHDIGFIAQEVKHILPEVVYGEEGHMTLSYGQITPVLTKAIQEQQQIIESQKSTIDTLKGQVNTLANKQAQDEQEIADLKKMVNAMTSVQAGTK